MPDDKLHVELRRLERGQLKAFADVTIPTALGEITIRGFRVVQKDGDSPWVALPTTSYSSNGSQVNKPLIDVARGVKQRLSEAILLEFRRVP